MTLLAKCGFDFGVDRIGNQMMAKNVVVSRARPRLPENPVIEELVHAARDRRAREIRNVADERNAAARPDDGGDLRHGATLFAESFDALGDHAGHRSGFDSGFAVLEHHADSALEKERVSLALRIQGAHQIETVASQRVDPVDELAHLRFVEPFEFELFYAGVGAQRALECAERMTQGRLLLPAGYDQQHRRARCIAEDAPQRLDRRRSRPV